MTPRATPTPTPAAAPVESPPLLLSSSFEEESPLEPDELVEPEPELEPVVVAAESVVVVTSPVEVAGSFSCLLAFVRRYYPSKTSYVGENSAVGAIIDILHACPEPPLGGLIRLGADIRVQEERTAGNDIEVIVGSVLDIV